VKFQFQILLHGVIPGARFGSQPVGSESRVDTVLTGRERDGVTITMADVSKIIETEQLIEKLTGLRCHIEQIR
jgi:hypothetical protein